MDSAYTRVRPFCTPTHRLGKLVLVNKRGRASKVPSCKGSQAPPPLMLVYDPLQAEYPSAAKATAATNVYLRLILARTTCLLDRRSGTTADLITLR